MGQARRALTAPYEQVASANEPANSGYNCAMPTPILATKLYIPPPRPHAVLRPRLFERLNGGLRRKLTLISAPAGFGKTTLVSEWLAACQMPAAWLSLDAADRDPARFLSYLVAALQTVVPAIGDGVAEALQAAQPASIDALLAALLNDISAAPKQGISARARRFPYRRGPATQRRARFSARSPAAPDAPSDHHPRGPPATLGTPTRPRPADRAARRRFALYASRSRRISQPGHAARPRGRGRERSGGAHRRLGCRPAAGRAFAARARRRCRLCASLRRR